MAFEAGKLRSVGTNFRETSPSTYVYDTGDTYAVMAANNYFPKNLFDGKGGFVNFVTSDLVGVIFVEIKAGAVKSVGVARLARA